MNEMAAVAHAEDVSALDVETKFSYYNVRVPLRSGRSMLFNSRTERLAVLSSEEDGLLTSQPQGSQLPLRFLRALVAAGFYVPRDLDETDAVSNRFEESRRSGHMNLTIAATLKCNLACGYCFQGQNKPSKRMDDSVQQQLIAYLETRIAGLQSLNLCWYGGEPLMNQKEIWRTSSAVSTLCQEHKVSYSAFIITNGYLLTPEVATQLCNHGVTAAQITIDGLAEDHDRMRPHITNRGSFDRILQNVEEVLGGSPLSIVLRINLDARNADGVKKLLQLLAERELNSSGRLQVYFAPVEGTTSGCATYDTMISSKQKYADLEIELIRLAAKLKLRTHSRFGQELGLCQAVRPSDLVITPTGELHKCWDTVSYSDMKVGSIFDPDASERLGDSAWTSWAPTQNPICRACKILPICGGGCAYKTVHESETTGEMGSLPCISAKFNLAEQLFEIALASGAVETAEWDGERSPTMANGVLKTGQRHSYETVKAAAAMRA